MFSGSREFLLHLKKQRPILGILFAYLETVQYYIKISSSKGIKIINKAYLYEKGLYNSPVIIHI